MKRSKLTRMWLVIIMIGVSIPLHATLPQKPTHTLILIRHAERGDGDELTKEGEKRALYFATIFKDQAVNKIYATNYNRTQLTVTPLSKDKNLPVTTYESNQQLLTSLHHDIKNNEPQTIVIVGHSNTLADLIYNLGGPSLQDIPEKEFDHLYLLTKSADGLGFVHLHYHVA